MTVGTPLSSSASESARLSSVTSASHCRSLSLRMGESKGESRCVEFSASFVVRFGSVRFGSGFGSKQTKKHAG